MTDFLKTYGDTLGPLGFPMKDQAAQALDALLDTLPEVSVGKIITQKAQTDLSAGERADIAWITTESLDRYQEIVLASGMDDTHFKGNPVVTLDHKYHIPPVGLSLWRRRMREGDTKGIKAKTHYPPRPEGWLDDRCWEPDEAFSLIQAGLMVGKSITFLTLEAREPTEQEVKKEPALLSCRRIVTKWLLLEYACTWLPVNQEAITEQVSKSVTALNLPLAQQETTPQKVIPFTSEEAIQKAIERHLGSLSPDQMLQAALDKLRGRV